MVQFVPCEEKNTAITLEMHVSRRPAWLYTMEGMHVGGESGVLESPDSFLKTIESHNCMLIDWHTCIRTKFRQFETYRMMERL